MIEISKRSSKSWCSIFDTF